MSAGSFRDRLFVDFVDLADLSRYPEAGVTKRDFREEDEFQNGHIRVETGSLLVSMLVGAVTVLLGLFFLCK